MKVAHNKMVTTFITGECSACDWKTERMQEKLDIESARKAAITHVKETGHQIWLAVRMAECFDPDPTGE